MSFLGRGNDNVPAPALALSPSCCVLYLVRSTPVVEATLECTPARGESPAGRSRVGGSASVDDVEEASGRRRSGWWSS